MKYLLPFFVFYVHPVTQQYDQELFEKYVCNHSSHYEKYDDDACPSYRLKVSIALLCQLCSTHYTAVQINNCLKKYLCNQGSHYEKYGRFSVKQRKPSRATTKSTLLTVSKDEWNTKENTGKSLKNALHILQYAKKRLKQRQKTKKFKPVALTSIELWWSEGIRQAVNQSVEILLNKKIHRKFLKAFWELV